MKVARPSRISGGFFKLIPGGKGQPQYEPYPMQRAIHANRALYRVACLGRQVGKSELAAAEASYELCTQVGSNGWIVAPTFEQAEIIFSRTMQKVQGALTHPEFAHLKARYKKGAKLEIEVEHYDRDWRTPGAVLLGRANFKGKSGKEPDNLVGATLTYLIIDEAAVMQEQAWTQALSPMLSTTQGWVLFISTPRGFNWFYEAYMRGESTSPEDVAWESFNAPSWDANPDVPRSYYEDQKLKKPELEFRQEFGAEFVSNSGSVFQGVDTVPKLEIRPELSDYERERLLCAEPDRRHTYVIGADFGRLQDYTVYTVLDLNTRQMVASYRYSFVDWDRQLEALKEVSDTWQGALVVGDNNGVGDRLEAEAGKLGIPFEGLKFTGTAVKSECINHLAIGLEQGYLAIQNDPSLIKELRLYKYNRTASGQLTMKAEGRGHDDRVVSLALAYSKLEHTGALPELSAHDADILSLADSDFDGFASLVSGGEGNVFGLEGFVHGSINDGLDGLGALGELDALNLRLVN